MGRRSSVPCIFPARSPVPFARAFFAFFAFLCLCICFSLSSVLCLFGSAHQGAHPHRLQLCVPVSDSSGTSLKPALTRSQTPPTPAPGCRFTAPATGLSSPGAELALSGRNGGCTVWKWPRILPRAEAARPAFLSSFLFSTDACILLAMSDLGGLPHWWSLGRVGRPGPYPQCPQRGRAARSPQW